MNGAGVLAVAANHDQSGGWFLLLRPVIMRSGLACGHRVSPHGRTVSFVSWRWHPEQREGWSGQQFLTKSCQRIPRIIHWQRMWKASSFRRSSCRSVHVSEPYDKMDSILVWYRRSFVCSWNRVCCQTLFIECMAVEAMPVRLIMSGWHLPEVGISCQRNSGYRPSRVNIMAHGLSTFLPIPSLRLHTHLSLSTKGGRATTTLQPIPVQSQYFFTSQVAATLKSLD